MSETSSDTESSCGWTIISNEGSDIETLGSEAVEHGAELLERPPAGEAELQDMQASASTAVCVEEGTAGSLDGTLVEQSIHETLYESEDVRGAPDAAPVALLSSSDHSDIVTLDSKGHACAENEEEDEEEEEEGAVGEELYLGTPCSSQYTFTAADTGIQAAATTSSSSEDEEGRGGPTVVRRRRLRKNTASMLTEPEDEELDLSRQEEEEEEEEEDEEDEEEGDAGQLEKQANVKAPPPAGVQSVKRRSSSVLNKCIVVALIVAISMGFGHFHGTVQIQERQKTAEKIRLGELDGVRDLLQRHVDERPPTDWIQGLDDLDEHVVISLLADVVEQLQKENQKLSTKQAQIQAQRDTKIRELEAMEAGADSLMSENQKLRDQLEEEKQLVQNFQNQKEDMMAEAETLRMEIDREKAATDELQAELSLLRSHILAADSQSSSAEELQSRLKELENRLHFEQQRSDLWERLYLETKEERAKGDTETKVKKQRSGMSGKVKDTFDAVKNSTKEFVYHHKEQIKKAKEAVKENLRKFSDSVKLTFRNFKDSASTLFDKARDLYDKKKDGRRSKEMWQHRFNKPSRKNSYQFQDAFQFQSSTRKSGGNADKEQNPSKSNLKGCSGVFDCAYQESMSFFNEAMEPIKVDEFHQLLRSYLQQEVHTFRHWKDLEAFIGAFFDNGVFIHDQMLFTDFVSDVGDYLTEIHEDQGLDDVFKGFDDYIYRHFFGEAYMKTYHPNGPFQGPDSNPKESRPKPQHRRQQRPKARPLGERKWSRSEKNADRNIADVKIELGPMPFDPKY